MSTTVDLDELDRLHASLPTLTAEEVLMEASRDTHFASIASVECVIYPHVKNDENRARMAAAARAAVAILNAYPELSAELKGTRKMEAEALLALAKVADLLSENGCDCECGHHYEEHDDDCERCLACRVDACFTRPIRDAIHEVPR